MFHVKPIKVINKTVAAITVFVFLITPIQLIATPLYIDAKAAIIVDKKSGSILYKENHEEVLGIASITKLMSIYVVFEELIKQGLTLEDEVVVSHRVARLKSQAPTMSGVWLQQGDILTVDELINLSLIFSDNSAIIQLAEFVSGSEEEHVEKMNDKVEKWGLQSTQFYNVTGLTNGDYGDVMIEGAKKMQYNVSTVKEVAFFSKKTLDDFPEIINYTATPVYEYKGEYLYNYNLLLPGSLLHYEGVVGLKTGTSLEAKSNFVSFFLHEEEEYITVVLGVEGVVERFNETIKMLNYIKKQELQVKISTNEEVQVKIESALSYSEISLYPKWGVTSFNRGGVNLKLNDILYSKEYFDNNNKLIKTIPKGDVVLSYTFKNILDTGTVENLNSKDGEFILEMIAQEDVLYQGRLLDAIDKGLEFFADMYHSVLKV